MSDDPPDTPDLELPFTDEPDLELPLGAAPCATLIPDAAEPSATLIPDDVDLELPFTPDLAPRARPASRPPSHPSAPPSQASTAPGARAPVVQGPWRESEQLTRWALKAQDTAPWHPFVLLGEEATEDLEAAQGRYEACRAYLRRLAERGGGQAVIATLVLDDPRFAKLRGLDEARWAEEVEAWRRARPLWDELVADVRRIARDDKLSEDEEEELVRWSARLGITREQLDAEVVAHIDASWRSLRRVAADSGLKLRLIPGVLITSAAQLAEVARSAEERWLQAAEAMQTLRVILRNVSGPEADALRAAVEAGAARARAFAESTGRPWGQASANALWLQCAIWTLEDPPGLALPQPWDERVASSTEQLVAQVDGQLARLEPALKDGRLVAWLETLRSHPELARRLAEGHDATEVALWGLLHELGEPRVFVGGRPARSGGALRLLLDGGDPSVLSDFDGLLRQGVLQTWARLTGQTEVLDAASRAFAGPDPAARRRVFAWALGSAVLVDGVTDPAGLVDFVRAKPAEAWALLRDGTISAWSMARGFSTSALRGERAWTQPRALHEALWQMGQGALVLRGERFEDLAALLARLSRADEGAAALLLQAEALWQDGTLPTWLAKQGRAPKVPEGLEGGQAMRYALWAAGLEAFHHPDSGWLATPEAMGAWGSARPEALYRVLRQGAGVVWLGLVDPERFKRVLAALQEVKDVRDAAERALRILGQPTPQLELSSPEVDFGRVLEGRSRSEELVLKNAGPRGHLRLALSAPDDPQLEVSLDRADAGGVLRLKPGESATLRLTVQVAAGRSSRGEEALRLAVDGEARDIPLRYASSFDLTRLIGVTAITTALGAAAGLGWRQLLAVAAGQTILAADGAYLSDLELMVGHAGPHRLAHLGLLVLCGGFGGALVLLAWLRWRGR